MSNVGTAAFLRQDVSVDAAEISFTGRFPNLHRSSAGWFRPIVVTSGYRQRLSTVEVRPWLSSSPLLLLRSMLRARRGVFVVALLSVCCVSHETPRNRCDAPPKQ